MEKIMKLAALMREAKTLVEEINSEGAYSIISASVDMAEDDAYTSQKQAEIFFYKDMPDFCTQKTRKLLNTDSGEIYEDSAIFNGVKLYHLVTEGEDNAKMAV